MKARIVRERGYINKRLNYEDMAGYEYWPCGIGATRPEFQGKRRGQFPTLRADRSVRSPVTHFWTQ